MTPDAAPVVVAQRLRKGSYGSRGDGEAAGERCVEDGAHPVAGQCADARTLAFYGPSLVGGTVNRPALGLDQRPAGPPRSGPRSRGSPRQRGKPPRAARPPRRAPKTRRQDQTSRREVEVAGRRQRLSPHYSVVMGDDSRGPPGRLVANPVAIVASRRMRGPPSNSTSP